MTLIERMRRLGLQVDVRRCSRPRRWRHSAASHCGTDRTVEVPPNRIPPGCEAITPEMLPLVRADAGGDRARSSSAVPGGAANVQDIYPLAPLQEGILFHHLMERRGRSLPVGQPAQLRYPCAAGALSERPAGGDRPARHFAYGGAVGGTVRAGAGGVAQGRLHVEEVVLDPADGDVAEQLYARFDPRRYRIDVRQAPLLRVYIAYDPARAIAG